MTVEKRLAKLGPERVDVIKNKLMAGIAAMTVAKLIQLEWQECQEVAEKTLTQQLNRYKKKLLATIPEAKMVKAKGKDGVVRERISLKALVQGGSPLQVLKEMQTLYVAQQGRVEWLLNMEQEIGKPITHLTFIIEAQKELLKEIQKMRFDLGLDEFKGVVPGVRGAMVATTTPNGTQVQASVFEAVNLVEEIFKKREITLPSGPPPTIDG